MKLQNPWPANKRVTSPYGYRIHPIEGVRKLHRGVDVAGRFPVTAAGDGIVHSKGFNARGGGHWVKIDHGSGIYSVYYHGAQATKWSKGERISAGSEIYTSGSTGASTGDHLHFEIRKGNPAWGFDVDPMPYLSGSGDGPGSGSIRVTGRLDRDTIRKWQEILNREGFDAGMVDGRMGPRTIKAIQRSVGVRPSDDLGSVTRQAVQRHLGEREDGVWGRLTVSAIQRKLNTGSWAK
jgi:hypothetical protein